MGIDPINPGYPPGDDCVNCQDIIFNGITPLYVEAYVSGISACPAAGPLQPPSGVFVLTQIAPCSWLFFDGVIAYQWTLTDVDSNFVIAAHPILWFSHTDPTECVSTFTNQLACGPANHFGTGGAVEVFWGPTLRT